MKISDFEVTHLTHDSREVVPGSCFFALPGTKTNGEMYVKQAISRGAVCVVTEHKLDEKIPQLVVENVREFMALCAKRFYGDIADKLEIIAVVGTNGKTTCTYMMRQILAERFGQKRIGIIGTLGVWIGGKKIETGMTTPDPIELHKIFYQMNAAGVRIVVMEASAHAIHYAKLAGLKFRVGIFTNITRDHLDFFDSFEKYRQTKIDFFGGNVQSAVINIDDQAGREIIEKRNGLVNITYSENEITGLKLHPHGSSFKILRECIKLDLPARFNIYNAIACIKAARELGIRMSTIKRALRKLPQIPGRFNVFKQRARTGGTFTAIVDFAHTPDGLEKILRTVREFTKNRVIVVFGCGGNRDKTKREVMGSIAANNADFVAITSDNPRDETPRGIMLQIEAGVKTVPSARYEMIEDRTEAINYALNMALAGDTVVIAGKGGEEYTEIAGEKIRYTDRDVILKHESTQAKDRICKR